MVVPTQHLRAVARADGGPPSGPTPSSSAWPRGSSRRTLLRPSQMVAELTARPRPGAGRGDVGSEPGPGDRRRPAGGHGGGHARRRRRRRRRRPALMSARFRVYTSTDVVGCEIGGAVKNVIAIAAGIADGLGYGWNTRAALDHPGAGRAGPARRGPRRRSAHVPGPGRQRRPHRHLQQPAEPEPPGRRSSSGQGRALADVLADMTMVAEGVTSAPAVLALAEHGGRGPADRRGGSGGAGGRAVGRSRWSRSLMARAGTTELHDLLGPGWDLTPTARTPAPRRGDRRGGTIVVIRATASPAPPPGGFPQLWARSFDA